MVFSSCRLETSPSGRGLPNPCAPNAIRRASPAVRVSFKAPISCARRFRFVLAGIVPLTSIHLLLSVPADILESAVLVEGVIKPFHQLRKHPLLAAGQVQHPGNAEDDQEVFDRADARPYP